MTSLPNPLATLAKAANILRRQDDPNVSAFGRDVAEWIESGAAEPLDSALGFRSQGGVSLKRAMALAERDRQLRRLHCICWLDLPPAAAARAMNISARRYESDRWPRERNGEPPASEPALTWWRILRSGETLPGTRQIIRVLSNHDIQKRV